MFDFDASKLLIIGVVALIVIGPKDLPRVLRQVGQMVGKLRRMAAEFQGQFMDAMKEADLADLKAEVGKLKDSATLDVNFDPVRDVREQISSVIGPASNVPGNVASISPHAPFGDGSLPAPAPAEPAIVGAVRASDPVYLEPAAPAHHTPAAVAGAVHSVEAEIGEAGRRRRVVVAKRRPPGDRVAAGPAPSRARTLLPPRRDPRP